MPPTTRKLVADELVIYCTKRRNADLIVRNIKMPKRALIIFATVAWLSGCTPAEGNGSQILVGSWRLISSEGHRSDGAVTYDQGETPKGRVMFDASGRLSIHLTRPNRSNFVSGDFLRPTPDECKDAARDYFGYFGSYTVDEDAGIITFHVEGAAYPNYVGTDQKRYYTIEGNRLILRTPPERAGGADVTYYVTWEREL
jgi:hypothetical protein